MNRKKPNLIKTIFGEELNLNQSQVLIIEAIFLYYGTLSSYQQHLCEYLKNIVQKNQVRNQLILSDKFFNNLTYHELSEKYKISEVGCYKIVKLALQRTRYAIAKQKLLKGFYE